MTLMNLIRHERGLPVSGYLLEDAK